MINVLDAQEKNPKGMEDMILVAVDTVIRPFFKKYQAYIDHYSN